MNFTEQGSNAAKEHTPDYFKQVMSPGMSDFKLKTLKAEIKDVF